MQIIPRRVSGVFFLCIVVTPVEGKPYPEEPDGFEGFRIGIGRIDHPDLAGNVHPCVELDHDAGALPARKGSHRAVFQEGKINMGRMHRQQSQRSGSLGGIGNEEGISPLGRSVKTDPDLPAEDELEPADGCSHDAQDRA